MVHIFGQVIKNILARGQRIKGKDTVHYIMQMERFTKKETGNMASLMN